MKRKLADLTASLFDFALDADEIAFAQLVKDFCSKRCLAHHARDPGHAQRFTVAREHRRNGKRQLIGRGGQNAADSAGNSEGEHWRESRRFASAARRETSPATLTLSARGKRTGARARVAPEGLALARVRPRATETRRGMRRACLDSRCAIADAMTRSRLLLVEHLWVADREQG